MSAKKILAVGFDIPSDDTEYSDFQSKVSLLDWDVILFRPQINAFYDYGDDYKGEHRLSDHSSFQLKECCEHWRHEIKQAVETGNTVVAFRPELQEVYVDTGLRTYSGTGRNRHTTRQVTTPANQIRQTGSECQ